MEENQEFLLELYQFAMKMGALGKKGTTTTGTIIGGRVQIAATNTTKLPNWPAEEVIKEAERQLREYYGDRVQFGHATSGEYAILNVIPKSTATMFLLTCFIIESTANKTSQTHVSKLVYGKDESDARAKFEQYLKENYPNAGEFGLAIQNQTIL